jgi:hypothetical protein
MISILLYLLITPASAECLQWHDISGHEYCLTADDYANHHGIFQDSNTAISTSPQPHCDDGWILMTFPGTAIPMCADIKGLKTPQ